MAAVALFAYSCSYDDSGLIDRIEDLENRVEKLEQACKDINSNIEALQALVKALQENDYVTSVTPITENGEVVGYTINFVKGDPITIYHGEDGKDGQNGADGKDGYTPQIGVREDVDGVIYWTIDGDWLLDEDGNKVKAVGADGADGTDGVDGQNGTTPSLKIEEGYWYVSLDGGATWTELGKATGEDGKDGADGDSMFEGIEQDDNYVYVYLSDGTTLILPKAEISLATIDTAAYYTFTKADKVEAGEWYLIVADDKAAQPVAADKGYGYLAVANVEDKDGVINTLGAYAFGVMPANGGYTLMQPDGRFLYQSGNYNSFNVNAKPNEGFVWSITANEDGTFKILNNSVNKYVQFDSEFTSYGSYADARGTMPVLYKLTGEGVAPEPEPEPETITPIADVLALGVDSTIESAVIEAVVISNMDLNNLTSKKGLYVQDETAGLQFYLAANHELKRGDKVRIDLSGVKIGQYNEAIQISGLALDKITVVSSDNEVVAKSVTMADFLANKYEGQYVAIEGVQVAEADLAKTWVVGGAHTSINIEDAEGNSFVVFSSKYATYGAETVAQGSGVLKGISGYNKGAVQIIFSSVEDFAGLTGERLGDDGGNEPSDPVVPEVTNRDDFNTVAWNSSYIARETTAGWIGENCAVQAGGPKDANPVFPSMLGTDENVRAFVINGKTTAVGKIISPALTGGLGTLSFKYGCAFSEKNGVDFKVEIEQNGAIVKTFQVTNDDTTKYKVTEWSQEVNVAGDFKIIITNNCPSAAADSNKDRYSIWDVMWTNYEGGAEQPVVKELSFTKASLFSTMGAYTIRFTNDDESHIMFLYFYSDKNYVPAGTYTDGYNNGNFSGAQSYVYLANSDERLNYTSGSITVDLTEDNVYTFTFNDLVFGDKDVKGSWSGKIDGLAQPAESPAVVFTNAKFLVNGGYGSSAYQFTNEEGWQINLYFDTTHTKPLQAGTYKGASYCNGGWQWDNYDTKLTIPASASSTGSRETGLKFTDGTVVVALDGDTYTVTMDMTLAKDKSNFKASFTGTIAQ